MSDSESITPTDDGALQNAERALDTQLKLATGLAESAFKAAMHLPNPGTLAAMDRVVDLIKSFRNEAQRLRNNGRPAMQDRLTVVLNDLMLARTTLANTLGILSTANAADTAKLAKAQADLAAQQKAGNDARLAQAQNHAREVGKLL